MDQACLVEIVFTASDLTGRRYTAYRTVLCRLFYRSMGQHSRMVLHGVLKAKILVEKAQPHSCKARLVQYALH